MLVRFAGYAASALLLVAVFAGAQEPSAKEHPGIRPSLVLEVRTKLSSETARVGDEVRFKTVQGALLNGKVVPENSEVIGRVILARRHQESTSAQLCIRLERLVSRHGDIALKGYLTHELVTRLVYYDSFGVKKPLRQIPQYMPDLETVKTEDGTATLVRERRDITLKKGMSMIGELFVIENRIAGP